MGLKEFKEKILSDNAFAEKVKGIKELEELVAFAKEEGYTFTVDDINKDTELSDGDLDGVAGGVQNFFGAIKIFYRGF